MKTIKKKKKPLCLPLCDYELWDHFHQLMPRRVVFFSFPFKVLTLSFAAGRNPATVLAPAVASVSWVAHSWPVSNASTGAQRS